MSIRKEVVLVDLNIQVNPLNHSLKFFMCMCLVSSDQVCAQNSHGFFCMSKQLLSSALPS